MPVGDPRVVVNPAPVEGDLFDLVLDLPARESNMMGTLLSYFDNTH